MSLLDDVDAPPSTNGAQPHVAPSVAPAHGTTTVQRPRTVVVPPKSPPRRILRVRPGDRRKTDLYAIVGAFLAALSLSTIIYTQIAPFGGLFGFLVVTYALFLTVYAIVVSIGGNGPEVADRIAEVVISTLGLTLLFALVTVIGYTAVRGWTALVHWSFFTQDMTFAGPLDPIDVGGIQHAIVGTLIMISIALAIVIPLGITCAVFLNEIPGKFSRFVRTIVEAMTALPSIVAGLFIYAFWILILGKDKSGFAASLAISVMMLPIIIRASDVVIRLVPGTLKEASYAMGAGQWRTVWHVVLPTSRSGLTTAVILGTARGVGETSPVLLTAGFTSSLNTNPFDGPMISLPLAVFEFVKSPQPTMRERAFGCALVLMLVVLVLFILARIVGGRGPGQLSPRQMRKARAQSKRDAARFAARDSGRVPAMAAAGAGSGSAGAASDGDPEDEYVDPQFQYPETELSLYSGEAAVFREVYNPETTDPERNVRSEPDHLA